MTKHKFSDAPGKPDGLVLGRDRGVPFGKPFSYTDAYDLTVGQRRYHGSKDFGDPMAPHVPWYKPWLKWRWRRPIAWAVVEPDDDRHVPVAHIQYNDIGVIRVSGVEPRALIPLYDEDVILASDFYESEQEKKDGGSTT